jgi:hypothetical protein
MIRPSSRASSMPCRSSPRRPAAGLPRPLRRRPVRHRLRNGLRQPCGVSLDLDGICYDPCRMSMATRSARTCWPAAIRNCARPVQRGTRRGDPDSPRRPQPVMSRSCCALPVSAALTISSARPTNGTKSASSATPSACSREKRVDLQRAWSETSYQHAGCATTRAAPSRSSTASSTHRSRPVGALL